MDRVREGGRERETPTFFLLYLHMCVRSTHDCSSPPLCGSSNLEKAEVWSYDRDLCYMMSCDTNV